MIAMLMTLIKLRLRQMLSSLSSRGKRSQKGIGEAGMIILFFFAGISFLFLFGTMAFAMGIGFIPANLEWMYFGIMSIMMFMLCFIGTIFMAKQQMFEAKDNQTLLSMPIKPRDILLSRIISIGATNYFLALLIGLPFGIVYIILEGFSFAGAVFFILGLILIPLLALSLSMLFGWILAVVSGRMKYKNAVNLIISSAFLMAYFYFCFSWQNRLEGLVERGAEVADTLSKYLPPVYHFGKAAAEGNVLSFLIFAAFCVIPFIVAVIIISKNFIKIITTERGNTKVEYKGGEMKASSEFKALASIELKRLTSSPSYMLNGGTGLLFILMAAFFFLLRKGQMEEALAEFGSIGKYIGPTMIVGMLYMCSMNIISAGTISMEGKTLWQLKSLPIDPKSVLLSKLYPHIVVSLPIVVLACILLQFGIDDMSILGRILLILIPIAATFFNAVLGVRINLSHPKFDWINEAQAIKQGASPMLTMVLGMAMALISMFMLILNGIFSLLPMDAVLVVILVIYALATIILYRWLMTKGVLKFDRLQNDYS